jgi:hypothetical protein
MVGRMMNPINWLTEHIPRNGVEAEKTAMSLLKLVFWAALLAPVIIVPAYYILVVLGVAPPIHLPPG